MKFEEKDIYEFYDNVANYYKEKDLQDDRELLLVDNILDKNECFYVVDLQVGKVVMYNGFDRLLGYTDVEISLEFIQSIQEPLEGDILNRITRSSILHCLSKPNMCTDAVLQTSFSLRKRDNTYIKVVSNSTPFRINEDGYLTHFLVKLLDISFLDTSKYVSCFFYAKDLDRRAFRKQVYSAYHDFFTERELDVIKEIAIGNTNSKIAENLFISKHTVVTHRKNILKKSNLNNTDELILFCKERGII